MSEKVYTPIHKGNFYENIPYKKYICTSLPMPLGEVFDITKFGASSEKENNAECINSAITACSQSGGGVVLVSSGKYFCGTLYLQDNVTLYIQDGASLVAVHDASKFDKAFIRADGVSNVAIMGPGKICGEGEFFHVAPPMTPMLEEPQVSDVVAMEREFRLRVRHGIKDRPDAMFLFHHSSMLRFENLIIENSMNWCLHVNTSDGVVIKNVVINNNRQIANADGIDIVGTRNVEISDTFISTADDGIVLKCLKGTGAVENVTVRNCHIISTCNAFKIGTETYHDINNILVENCTFELPDIYPGTISGIAVESADGSVINNVIARNIVMNKVTCPVFVRVCARNRYGTPEKPPKICNVLVENIVATNAELPIIIAGVKTNDGTIHCAEDITLNNINITYKDIAANVNVILPIPEYEIKYPESWEFLDLPAYALWARHVVGLELHNFQTSKRSDETRKQIIIEQS
jgi:polygalacturonase